jgi:acetate kinase
MGGVDAIVFTAGVGENAPFIRMGACKDLEFMGVKIDVAKDLGRSPEPFEIQADDSRVKIYVIPTNEELEIATQTYNLIKG